MNYQNIKANIETELRKALTSAGDGAALNPYDLDQMLYEELLKLQPLAELLDVLPAGGKTHEYTVRSSHPLAWFEGEATPANAKNSVYARKTVQTKIQRIWGSVTGYAQAVDEAFIDALSTELEGSVEGMSNILEFGALWGAANDVGFTGDAYQYSGIVPRMLAYAPGNVIDAGGNKISLPDLDNALAAATGFRGVRGDPKLWMMGIKMKNVVDGLQTAVNIPLTEAELADGKIIMAAYNGVPIMESDYVVPAATSTSPTDLAAAEDDGNGALPADQYFYNISSVTVYGEQIAGTEANATVTGGGDAIDLTWTADANAVAYMIWRGLATGNANLQLLDIVPALTYDAAGTVNGAVEAYKDTGARTPIAVKPLSSGEENIVLVNRNSRKGAAFVGKVDDMGRAISNLFSYVELARTKDTYDYMIKGYLALRLVHPNLVAMIRHAKLA
jgi:hypothetical protein